MLAVGVLAGGVVCDGTSLAVFPGKMPFAGVVIILCGLAFSPYLFFFLFPNIASLSLYARCVYFSCIRRCIAKFIVRRNGETQHGESEGVENYQKGLYKLALNVDLSARQSPQVFSHFFRFYSPFCRSFTAVETELI